MAKCLTKQDFLVDTRIMLLLFFFFLAMCLISHLAVKFPNSEEEGTENWEIAEVCFFFFYFFTELLFSSCSMVDYHEHLKILYLCSC